jgi:hypothetical protein
MTKDDILRMAREALNGVTTDERGSADLTPMLERFAALVAAAEREACAKVCESKMPNPVVNWSDAQIVEALRDCAAAIRARSNP